MASITIRNLDDPLKARLRVRAAHHGRSMEEEVRSILRDALVGDPQAAPHLALAVRQRFAVLGGVNVPVLPREPLRAPPGFEE